jgi:hypothetical protein
MNLPGMPWFDLTLLQTQRCHHLAWFLYGCAAREHVLNLDACLTWWVRAFTPAAARTFWVIPGLWKPGPRAW